MIATIRLVNKNNSSYVTIALPLSEGKETKPSMMIKGNRLTSIKMVKIQRNFLSQNLLYHQS